ncbi:hypothetical protein ACFYKX_12800 [Cytobacillus sp. FJAT-54145]|uniref:Uncharacterized protein n=1 Tax=Cytobacillus spartinae TaxID=3299023 RepID=A0ABW6KF03_9BACI
MLFNSFRKITPTNGFDANNRSNARQNDYAWAMDELGEFLYVGTGRNIPNLAFDALGLPIPDAFEPNNDYRAEIWRVKKDGSTDWELDFKTAERSFGFRYMIQFPRVSSNSQASGTPALYAAATSSDGEKAVIYRKRSNTDSWTEFARLAGETSRSMVEHNGRLYVATVPLASTNDVPQLFRLNIARTGFDPVSLPSDITGEIVSMISFNGHLYIGLAKTGGFDIWRTNGADPSSGWRLVVDRGAGDAINIIPFEMDEFDDCIYVGTGMVPFLPLLSESTVITKGFDIVRIDKEDNWEIVVGGLPSERTNPTTGNRNLSLYPSGFGNPFNAYCWQVRKFGDTLYAGSFDWSVVIPPALQSLLEEIMDDEDPSVTENLMESFITTILNTSSAIPNLLFGFGLWKSRNGRLWTPVSVNGFNNPRNYGVRNLFASSDGKLYLGTANPFQGCEVWVKDKNHDHNLFDIHRWSIDKLKDLLSELKK